jgi:putative transposase
MAKQWRIEYSGALYHIMSRGNEGRDIFLDEDDCVLFLKVLKDMTLRFNVEVYAWVLMSNHYHLLIRIKEPNLCRCIHWLGVTFTRCYNIKHKRQGHLFQGRHKSLIIKNKDYLLRLSCCIH